MYAQRVSTAISMRRFQTRIAVNLVPFTHAKGTDMKEANHSGVAVDQIRVETRQIALKHL